MICSQISDLIGFSCHPLDDQGQIALIETPFVFSDGDEVPVFVERVGSRVRFFDDGGFYLHFRGRGLGLRNATQTRFLSTAAEQHGGAFTKDGVLEVWSSPNAAPQGFARYIGAAMELVRWESSHAGIAAETSLFIEEVAQCLTAWKPGGKLDRQPKIEGVTGKLHEFTFGIDGLLVAAVGLHHAAVSALIHKLIDIKANPENAHRKTLVVLDNRRDKESSRRESLVISGISDVIEMTRLQRQAGMTTTLQ